MSKVETFLSQAGTKIKQVAHIIITKVLPTAIKVAVAAEPAVDLGLTLAGLASLVPEYNIVAEAALATEQAAAILPAGMTSAQKFAAVVSAVEAKLLPALVAQGLTTDAATARLTKYVDAVVTTLNTFSAAAPKPALTTQEIAAVTIAPATA